MKELNNWWETLPIETKKELVKKYLSKNRTINFLTSKDISIMYKGETSK